MAFSDEEIFESMVDEQTRGPSCLTSRVPREEFASMHAYVRDDNHFARVDTWKAENPEKLKAAAAKYESTPLRRLEKAALRKPLVADLTPEQLEARRQYNAAYQKKYRAAQKMKTRVDSGS